MIKIPEARAKAADASLPTCDEDGKAFFRIRRTQARGGSNSTAVGSSCALVGLPVGAEAMIVAEEESAGVKVDRHGGAPRFRGRGEFLPLKRTPAWVHLRHYP